MNRDVIRRLVALWLLVAAFWPPSVHAQQKPKENAEVLVAVRGAAYGVPTNDAMRLEFWLAGAPNQIDTQTTGAGTSSITYTGGLHTLMKPNRHYQARVTPGAGTYGEIKLSPPPGYSVWINDRPTTTFRTDVTPWLVFKIELRADDGSGQLPAGEARPPQVGDLIWSIGAGQYSNGLSAGVVQWRATSLSAALLDPTSLNYMEPDSAEVAVTRHSDGALLELRTFQMVLYVRRNTTPGTGYDIEIYDPYAVRTGSGDGPYTYDVSPYRTYRISNPNGSTWNNQIRIERIEDSTETWTITQSGSDWTVVESSSLRTITRTSTGSAPRVETIEVKDNANNVATKLRRSYQTFGWGQEELVEEVANPDATNGPALTTTYTYHTTGGTGGYGRLKSVAGSDGNWTRFDYDDSTAGIGNLVAIYRPWQDGPTDPASATGSNCKATLFTYAGERNVFNELPAGAETKVLGTTVAKTTTSYAFPGNAPNGEPLRTETTQNYTASGTSLTSYRQVYNPTAASAHLLGHLRWEQAPDGTKVSVLRYKAYFWNYGDNNATVHKLWDPPVNNTWGEYRFKGFATQVQDSVAVTSWDGQTIETVYMVPNRSTVELSIFDAEGRVHFTVNYVFTGATGGVPTFEFAGMVEQTYSQGQPLAKATASGYYEINWWLSNGRLSGHHANDGVYTGYGRDALGRATLQSKDAIAASGEFPAHGAVYIHRAYDAADRVVTELVTPSISATPTAEAVNTTRVYNLAGLLTSETAESGAGNFTTTLTYTNGGRTVTVTRPGGATQVTDRWLDGSVKSVTGTGVVNEYRQTTVDSGTGNLVTTVYTLRSSDVSNPTAAPRWNRVTTDWAGRKVKEEHPAPPGASPATFTRQFYYNSISQPVKTTETGLADTLIAYNAWQQPYRSGLDLNANGSLDTAGTDRITETDTLFEKDGSAAWWAKTTTKAYNQDSNGTPITTGISKTRLNKFTNNIQAQTVTTDVFGNATTRTVTVDRGYGNVNQLITETIDHPDSTTDEVTVTRHGLLQKRQTKEGLVYRTYYDARSRPVKTTDPRTDTSTTARLGYVSNSDRVAWRQDTAGNQTDYTYESSTARLSTETLPAPAGGGTRPVTRYAYTTRGELYRQWGNGTYPVQYAYNDYGERTSQSTYRGGTGWDGTTWPGSPGAADTTTWAFDPASGTLTSQTDAANRTVNYTYNPRNQLLTRQWARILSGSTPVTTTYAYSSTTAELGSVDYNDSTPDLTYTYNRLGQTATVADATGTRTFNYSATTGQLQQEDLGSFIGSRSVTYTFDTAGSGTKGRLTNLATGLTSNPGNEYNIGYQYDTYGRMNQVWNMTYTYLADSNLISGIADAQTSWTQTRTYESSRDLLDVLETKWSASSKAKFDYTSDNLGRRTVVAKTGEMFTRYSANGLDTHYGYNEKSELTSEVTKLGGSSTILTGREDGYSYDQIGNRLTKTHNGNAAAYTPNELNQYVQRVVPGVIDVTGLAPSAATVTVNSSSTSVTRQNDWYYKPETVTNTSNAVWTSLAIASSYGGSETRNAFLPLTPEPFTYDLDGNLLSDGRWDYTYDAENRLVTMQTRSTVLGPIPNAEARRLEFKYDYLGRRVQKTVRGGWNGTSYTTVVSDTKNLYNGWNLLHEFSVDGATLTQVRSNIWGLDWSGTLQGAGGVGGLLYHNDVAAGVTMLPAYDGSGNVAAMLKRSDGSGTMVAAYEYDAYGNTLRATGANAAGNPFRFSTKYTDAETGLVYHETRYYSPSLGRFITRDSIGEQGGLNLYAYVSNQVPNAWDYLGMDTFLDFGGFNSDGGLIWNDGGDYTAMPRPDHNDLVTVATEDFRDGQWEASTMQLPRAYVQSWGSQTGFRSGDLINPFSVSAALAGIVDENQEADRREEAVIDAAIADLRASSGPHFSATLQSTPSTENGEELRTGSVVDSDKRIYGVIFVEGSIAQAKDGKNLVLLKSIEQQIKNANKMMQIRGIPGQVIWKPFSNLDDLTAQTKIHVRSDTVYTSAIAHGIMRNPSDRSTWTGQVGINGQAVSYTLWQNTFTKAARSVSENVGVYLINCSHLGFEYPDQIRTDLDPYIQRDKTK